MNFSATDGDTTAVMGAFGGSSHFQGVSWNKQKIKWVAQICTDGKSTHLGDFDDEEEAASAYDVAAEHVRRPLNFPAADSVSVTTLPQSDLVMEQPPENAAGGHWCMGKMEPQKSRFKGVCWNKRRHK